MYIVVVGFAQLPIPDASEFMRDVNRHDDPSKWVQRSSYPVQILHLIKIFPLRVMMCRKYTFALQYCNYNITVKRELYIRIRNSSPLFLLTYFEVIYTCLYIIRVLIRNYKGP